MMKRCRHERLEFLGKERSDDSVNMYYLCRVCGGVIVFTKNDKVYSVIKEK